MTKETSKSEYIPKNMLVSIVSNLGGQLCDVPRDGNCLYHAVAHQLRIVKIFGEDGIAYTHQSLRDLAMETIRNNPMVYQPFLDENTDIDTFIAEHSSIGKWADNIVIQALSDRLGVSIEITRSDNQPSETIIPNNGINPLRTIHLGYEVAIHYQSLITLEMLNNSEVNQRLKVLNALEGKGLKERSIEELFEKLKINENDQKKKYELTQNSNKPISNFSKIIIEDSELEKITTIKPVVPRGKSQEILEQSAHRQLVREKFELSKKMNDHITLFRVPDKVKLPPKEVKNHTVPGPQWTPSSSVGFVKGALSAGHRIWSATMPTNDKNGLQQKDGEPSILARELMTATLSGWKAREPKMNETYGNTDRSPKIVLTPPLSPKLVPTQIMQNLYDIKISWDKLPISPNELRKLSIPTTIRLSMFLTSFELDQENYDPTLLKIAAREGVIDLLEDRFVDIDEMQDTGTDIIEVLFEDKEVIALLSGREVDFVKLLEIYSNYIDGGDCNIGTFSFRKLLSVLDYNEKNFSYFFNLEVDIVEIIKIFELSTDFFSELAENINREFLKALNEAGLDIDWLITTFRENNELFYALIHDEHDLVTNLGLSDFIEQFECAQLKIKEENESASDFENDNPYDIVQSNYIEDMCPDELLANSEDTGNNFELSSDSGSTLSGSDSDLELMIN